MKAISDKLEIIASELELDYIRSSSLEESNIQIHYKNMSVPVIMYVGHGIIENYYEGAEPLQSVECDIYVLAKKHAADYEANLIDTVMVNLHQHASNIVYRFESERDTLEFTLEPVSLLDDMLIGYLLQVQFIIEGDACS